MHLPGFIMSPQEELDYAMADEELRVARLRQQRAEASVAALDPDIRHLVPSDFLAKAQVKAAQLVVYRLRNHYDNLCSVAGTNMAAGGDATSPGEAALPSDVTSVPSGPPRNDVDSAAKAKAKEKAPACQLTSDSDSYFSSDDDEVELIRFFRTPSQGRSTPPLPPLYQPRPKETPRKETRGITPVPPSQQCRSSSAPFTPSQGSSAPVTPKKVLSLPNNGLLRSPFLHRKHYSVIVGRRTGIYLSWTATKPLVSGLPGAMYQSFETFEEAMGDYFATRDKGYVMVKRLPGDSEAQFGHPDSTEDIFGFD